MGLAQEQQVQNMHAVNQALMEGKVVTIGTVFVHGVVVSEGKVCYLTMAERKNAKKKPFFCCPFKITAVVIDHLEKEVIRAWSPTGVGETIIYAPATEN